MQFLRVNMSDLTTRREEEPEDLRIWGGRGLADKILMAEVPPPCDPLGEQNKLIFAIGSLAGRGISSSDRLSVGSKSPLTRGIKEANSGGTAGRILARLGIKALIVEGKSQSGPRVLVVSKDREEFLPADEYAGMGVYKTTRLLLERFGKATNIISVGPAGEMQLSGAAIASTDPENNPGRFAARGGLGAVLGSKGLKAIVIEDTKDPVEPYIKNKEAFKEALKNFQKAILESFSTSVLLPEYGTAAMVGSMQKAGGLVTRNFRYGTFPDWSNLDGATIKQISARRKGAAKSSHACMPGCMIRCSNAFADKDGNLIVSPLEYESITMLGPNLGIGDIDEIARLNWLCNDIGVDTMEMGAALGVAMEGGLLPWGDSQAAKDLLEEIRQGTERGKALGNGTASVGKFAGVRRVPVAKGQGMPAYDPRCIKGLGVTYATSPQGADHTAGYPTTLPLDHHRPEGQTLISRGVQIFTGATDTLGLCIFLGEPIGMNVLLVPALMDAIYGDFDGQKMGNMGVEVMILERSFNRAAGFTAADDTLPDYFRTEPLPPFNLLFDVDDAKLKSTIPF